MLIQETLLNSQVGWLLFVCLGIIWVGLGLYWGRKAKNMDGFMLAGRNVGLALGTATAMATWITSNTTMLAPQFAFELGIWGMLAYSTASFGLFLFAPLAKRIRQLMPAGYTSGDFIRLRYGQAAWIVFLMISIFYSLTWLISMGMAGGILMNSLAGIPYQWGMSAILFVCVLYTLFGGLYAVIGTDYIQSLIILVGIVVVGCGVINHIGISDVYQHVSTEQPMLVNVLLPAAVMAFFNNMLFGIGEIFHSNVWWSRAFAMRKDVGQKAYFLSGAFWFPIPIAAGFIALAAGPLGINVTSPDMVGPVIAASMLGKVGAGIVFIVFFCSLASSIDSLLAATSDLITEDIYRKMIHPQATEQQLRKVAGFVVMGLGVFAWMVCLPRIGTLATVLFFAGPMVGSCIWPILTGLFWRRANARGAVAGMLSGTTIGLICYFSIGWYVASLIGAAVSMVVVLLVSASSKERFDWHVLDETQPV